MTPLGEAASQRQPSIQGLVALAITLFGMRSNPLVATLTSPEQAAISEICPVGA